MTKSAPPSPAAPTLGRTPAAEPASRRNFWALVGDGALFTVGQSFVDMNTIVPVFIASFTTSPALIGAAAALKVAGFYIPQLPTALAIRRLRHVKGLFFTLALVGRGGMLGTLPLALWADALPPTWVVGVFLGLYALLMFTDGASAIPWFDLIGRTVSPGRRGRLFGAMQLWGGAGAVAAGLLIQRVFAADLQFDMTYAILFTLGAAGLVASALCLLPIREPVADLELANGRVPVTGHLGGLLRQPWLRRVAVAQLAAGTVQVALPFYVIYARADLRLSDTWIGSFLLAQTVGAAIGGLIWGRMADRLGALAVISVCAMLLIVVPLLALVARAVPGGGGVVLLVLFGLAGAAPGGARLGFWKYVLDTVQPSDRRLCMGLLNTLNSPSLAMPLIGGTVLGVAGYTWLFLTSAAGGVLALLTAFVLPPARSRSS